MLVHIIITILNISIANPTTKDKVLKLSIMPNGIVLVIRMVLFFILPNFSFFMEHKNGGITLFSYIIQAIISMGIVYFFLNRRYEKNHPDEDATKDEIINTELNDVETEQNAQNTPDIIPLSKLLPVIVYVLTGIVLAFCVYSLFQIL
jgi:uncharacterized membrane protein